MTTFFKFKPSFVCAALLIFAFSLSILVVLFLPILVLVKAVLATLLLCLLAFYLLRDAWLLLASSPVAIRLKGKDIILLLRSGEELQGQILEDCVVTSFFTILNVLLVGKKRVRSILVFPDSIDSELNRELRVLLKWDN